MAITGRKCSLLRMKKYSLIAVLMNVLLVSHQSSKINCDDRSNMDDMSCTDPECLLSITIALGIFDNTIYQITADHFLSMYPIKNDKLILNGGVKMPLIKKLKKLDNSNPAYSDFINATALKPEDAISQLAVTMLENFNTISIAIAIVNDKYKKIFSYTEHLGGFKFTRFLLNSKVNRIISTFLSKNLIKKFSNSFIFFTDFNCENHKHKTYALYDATNRNVVQIFCIWKADNDKSKLKLRFIGSEKHCQYGDLDITSQIMDSIRFVFAYNDQINLVSINKSLIYWFDIYQFDQDIDIDLNRMPLKQLIIVKEFNWKLMIIIIVSFLILSLISFLIYYRLRHYWKRKKDDQMLKKVASVKANKILIMKNKRLKADLITEKDYSSTSTGKNITNPVTFKKFKYKKKLPK